MKAPGESTSSSLPSVQAALLDYFSAPGKYQLVLREPDTLFSSIRDVLQVAAGRSAPGDETGSERLREAAKFFIRAALLYPGADHYAVLGLARGAEPTDLKERYRLLMRLIHPDFAEADSADWPADAAVRVNRAYETLSSPVLRREYDEQLAATRVQPPPAAGPVRLAPSVVVHGRPAPARLNPRAAWALGLLCATGAILLLMPRQEPDHLVQTSSQVAFREPPSVQWARSANSQASEATAEAAVPVAPAGAPPAPEVTIPHGSPAPAPQLMAPAVPQAPAPTPARAISRSVLPQASPQPAPAPHRPQPPAAAPAPVAAAASPAPAVAWSEPVPPPPAAPVESAMAAAIAPSAPPLAALPVSTIPTAPKLTPTLAVRSAPTLGEAQPLITQLLQMLESGSGDQLLRLLEPGARQAPAAQQLSRQYENLVHGGRPVRLAQAEFHSEARDGVLLVTGRLRLHAGEPTIGSRGQLLLLRAEFAARNGKVMLTGLSGAPE